MTLYQTLSNTWWGAVRTEVHSVATWEVEFESTHREAEHLLCAIVTAARIECVDGRRLATQQHVTQRRTRESVVGHPGTCRHLSPPGPNQTHLTAIDAKPFTSIHPAFSASVHPSTRI